jgi:competence protein ComEC
LEGVHRAVLLVVLLANSLRAQSPRDSMLPRSDSLYLTHFDVGQGDATLITTPRGKRILIDAGGSGDSVAARIRRAGVDTIDLLVSSHNHIDHIGGMADVFATFAVKRYLDNNVPCASQICARTLAAAAVEPDLVDIDGGIGDTIDGVFVRYLPLPPRDSDENNNSIGVIVMFGNFRALYTGDSQADALSFWIRENVVPRVHVLKAAHHGSRNGITADWIATTLPSAVVISVGKNSYGHPSREVIQTWASLGAKVFRTDYLGTIQINVAKDGGFAVSFPKFPSSRPK